MITFIFDSYLQGLRYKPIIQMLKDNKIPSPKGNEVWCQSTIETILTNEKYTGDNLLQKTLYGKSIKNVDYELGRVNQYLVRNNHPGIISREKYDIVQKIRDNNTKNKHKGETHRISPYAYYFYSVDLGKYLTRIIEKHQNKYEVEMLLGIRNGQRVSFRFEYIKEGMMEMAKYLVDNRAAITTRLKEMKKPTLAKLELEKERLYNSLDGLPLSERLETYGIISDVRLRIGKLAKLSEMIDGYINIARKLSKEYDILLAKELFSSIVIEGLKVQCIISIGEKSIKIVRHNTYCFQTFEKQIIHLFEEKKLSFLGLIC